jgi:hypothetical protein
MKRIVSRAVLRIRDVYPRSRGQKGTGSRIRIRNGGHEMDILSRIIQLNQYFSVCAQIFEELTAVTLT